MARSKIIGAVEVGTAKAVVLVAELSGESMTIIGMGQSTMTGMRKGEVMDLHSVSNCVHAALMSAERTAAAKIEEVYCSLSGAHVQGFRHPGVTTISSNEGTVGKRDMERAVENARNKVLEPGRVYLHHVMNGYLLDGYPVDNPLGRSGSHLEVRYWHITGSEGQLRDHLDILSGYNLEVEDFMVDSLASGTLLAEDEEKRQGVLVLDIGKGTSDYVLYRGRRVLQTGVIPVGGEHITNDLSLGLRIKSKYAENLKLRAGRAMVEKNDRSDKVPLVGDYMIGDRLIPRVSVNKIIHARLEELFIILKNRLGSSLTRQNLPGGVILTGGVSQTEGILELAELTLDVAVNSGQCPDWVRMKELRGPEYATVLGLLYSALHDQQGRPEERMSAAALSQPRGGLFRKMANLFG